MTKPKQDPAVGERPVRRYVPPRAISLSDAEVGFGGSCSPGSYANGSCNTGGSAGGKCHTGVSAGGCGQGTAGNRPYPQNESYW